MQGLRKKRTWMVILALFLVVLLSITAFFFLGNRGQTASAEMISLTETVIKGSIQSTVVGSGSLGLEDGEDILLVSGLLPTQVSVQAGDLVEAGDVLALFDSASVKSAISSLQATLKSTEQQINKTKNDTETSTVKTYVSGRVKKIYAEKGKSVTATIAEHGALALVSTDGLMAVDVTTEVALSVGDTLKVTLASGSTKTGTVEGIANGVCTVTLTDNGPAFGEEVTLTTSGGEELGKGVLRIHKPVAITGGIGTVKTIHIKENGSVSSGSTAITLTDLPVSSQHEELLRKQAEYAALMQTLASIAEGNALKAPFSGTVQTVTLTAGTAVGDSASSVEGESSGQSSEDVGISALIISAHTNMVLTIEVDELDILSVQEGQKASISLDAIEGTSYTGTLSRISESGSGDGGVTKYEVEITMERDEDMRSGMNATATVIIEEKTDVLLLPASAVQEFGNRVFVYTQQDGTSLSGEIEVETGLSNGLFVEILSGLSEGDTVYYQMSVSGESEEIPTRMGGGMFPSGGGSMPDGGTPPQRGNEE